MSKIDVVDADAVAQYNKELLEVIKSSFETENSKTKCLVLVWDIQGMCLKTWSANASLLDAEFMLRTGCEIVERQIEIDTSPECDKDHTKELH